jgi:hypothetical protein
LRICRTYSRDREYPELDVVACNGLSVFARAAGGKALVLRGRKGEQDERGQRGERGLPGPPAPTVVAWEIEREA